MKSQFTTYPTAEAEKAALAKSLSLQIFSHRQQHAVSLLPLHNGDLTQLELNRAEAVWRRSERYRPILIAIYLASFLLIFQFLSGTTFLGAILNEVKTAQAQGQLAQVLA